MLYDSLLLLKSDYARISNSKETGRARRRKSPISVRDLVIPHGRLTRNCIHYRRIRLGSPRTCTEDAYVTWTSKLALINKYKIIFLILTKIGSRRKKTRASYLIASTCFFEDSTNGKYIMLLSPSKKSISSNSANICRFSSSIHNVEELFSRTS